MGQSLPTTHFAFRAFVAIGVSLGVLAMPLAIAAAPEELPAPAPKKEMPAPQDAPAADPQGSTHLERIVDFIRFMALLCDEHPVPRPLMPTGTIASMCGHLTPEGIDILERRFKDPDALALLRQQTPELAELLPLLAAAAPLVEQLEPQIQVVVARQDLSALQTRPDPVLPGIAIIFEPRDQRRSKSMLLATYWGLIRGINEKADKEKTPRILMTSGKRGEAFFASSRFQAPEAGATGERMRYNFTPAIGVVGERFIVSTSGDLTAKLIDLAQQQPAETQCARGPRIDLDLVCAAGLVMDNLNSPSGQQMAAATRVQVNHALDRLRGALADNGELSVRVPRLADRVRVRAATRRSQSSVQRMPLVRAGFQVLAEELTAELAAPTAEAK